MGKDQGIVCMVISLISFLITLIVLLSVTWRRVIAVKTTKNLENSKIKKAQLRLEVQRS